MELQSSFHNGMAASLPHLRDLFPTAWMRPGIEFRLEEINDRLRERERNIYPDRESVFAALELEPSMVRVIVIGQDPYPTPGMAIGRAFAVPRETRLLPGSLRNIFTELREDLGVENADPSLQTWQSQGVLLLNRILTVEEGAPLSHQHLGWQELTERIISLGVENGAVGLLWGREAAKSAPLFKGRAVIGVHPSPLSAHRGFFGSRPFSKVNELLDTPVNW